MTLFLVGLGGLVVGFVVGSLVYLLKAAREMTSLRAQLAAEQTRAAVLSTQMSTAREADAAQRTQIEDLTRLLASAEAEGANLRQRLDEDSARLANLQKQFTAEFENLANRVLEEKSTRFVAQNKESLAVLLDPLRQRIGEFRERIESIHTEETKATAALREQLVQLKDLNRQITEEAGALTRALKGESKTQGSWGELILERILEKSGLQKGSEYETQASFRDEAGGRRMPDVIIHLPEGKHIIIDAKVSLTAYERLVNATTDAARQAAMKEHALSVRRHVEELARKDYPGLADLQSPDFVLMFVPVESALNLALQDDPELYGSAFEKNVVLVSSSTLLITLRAIESVWRRHKQTLNALEIARRAGGLHDQFVAFTESLQEIGQRLDQARGAYDQAMGRLSTGRGNLVRRVTELQKLGARAEKQLTDSLAKQSEDEEPEASPEPPKKAEIPAPAQERLLGM